MNKRTLLALRKALADARRKPQTAFDLEALARGCGRRLRAGGNHPIWVSDHFPSHRPLPIGRHGGKPEVPPHAKKVILNGLEEDLQAWMERVDSVAGRDGEFDDDG
jgi:hypothetical protein